MDIDAVGRTSLLVAAMRAEESKRADRLFEDPFAETLAGDVGYAFLREGAKVGASTVPTIEVRTRYFDEAMLHAVGTGVRQVVILAAGMDARAYRLVWPGGVRLFELDRPAVLAYKHAKLAGAHPTCTRTAIPIDLADDWPGALRAHGFEPHAPTAWLAEGLTLYLDAAAVTTLIARIDALSPPGSVLLFDAVGQSLLDAPFMRPMLDAMAQSGSPWRFGTDEPESLVAPLGWTAVVTEPGEVGTRWGRWPFPHVPRSVPGVPRGYLVEATKR